MTKETTFIPNGVRLNGTISAKAKKVLVAVSKKTKVPQSVLVTNAILQALGPKKKKA